MAENKKASVERHLQSGALLAIGALAVWTLSTVHDTELVVSRQDERLAAVVRQLESNGTIIASMVKLTEDRYPRRAAMQDFLKRDRLIDALEARIDRLEVSKD